MEKAKACLIAAGFQAARKTYRKPKAVFFIAASADRPLCELKVFFSLLQGTVLE